MRHLTKFYQQAYAISYVTLVSIIMILTFSPNEFLMFDLLICLVICFFSITSKQISKINTAKTRTETDCPAINVSIDDLSYDKFYDDVIETLIIKTARDLLDTFHYHELISEQENDENRCILIYNTTIENIRSIAKNVLKKATKEKTDAIDLSLYLDSSEMASIINNISKTIIFLNEYCTETKIQFDQMIELLRPSLFASKKSKNIYKHIPKEPYFIDKGLKKFGDDTILLIKQELSQIMFRHPNKYPKILGNKMKIFIKPFMTT